MGQIVPKLNLNKTPYSAENNSLVFAKNIRVKDYIYLGNSATYGSEPNYLTSNKLKFVSGSNSTEIGVGSAILINPTY